SSDLIQAVSQRDRRGRGERNALVGRAEEQIDVLRAIVYQCLGIIAAQPGQAVAGVEQAGIEEVGALAAGLEGKFAEAQHVAIQREANEFPLILVHLLPSELTKLC